MNYLSICSGIEAASVAFHPLGWKAVGFSEIEPFPCAVLQHHYPNVQNFGDMTKFKEWRINEPIDIVCGGTPCQSFSVAGQRKSLGDERGNLSFTFCELCDHFSPQVVIWENVPGVLNTKDNAFGCFLAELAGLNEPVTPRKHPTKFDAFGVVNGQKRCVAWRILDAQYFGVPQRRRRVFVVAFRGAGNWRAAATLFPISESVQGSVAPSRSAMSGAAGYIETGFANYRESGIAGTARASGGALSGGSETFVVHGSQDPTVNIGFANPIGRNGGLEKVIALAGNTIGRSPNQGGNGLGFDDSGVSYTLTTNDIHGVVTYNTADVHTTLTTTVRRLTPIECERLQGFHDNYTKIPYRNKPVEYCPDGQRYKALGNSWAVPVVRWIGERINQIKDI